MNWSAGDLQAAYGRQYEFLILANKGRRKFNGKRYSDIWSFPRVVGKNQLHQNQKNLQLIERAVLAHSNEGETVFDGFLGSGTTAVAAKRLNRNFIGCELDGKHYNTTLERLKELD
jgi:site-specific DNA-methyltransferase (adenine-specific)